METRTGQGTFCSLASDASARVEVERQDWYHCSSSFVDTGNSAYEVRRPRDVGFGVAVAHRCPEGENQADRGNVLAGIGQRFLTVCGTASAVWGGRSFWRDPRVLPLPAGKDLPAKLSPPARFRGLARQIRDAHALYPAQLLLPG